MFGNNSTPLFGSQSATGQASAPTPSILGTGNQPAGSTPSTLFGSQPATGQSSTGAPSIFGTLNTAPTGGTQPLFGVQASKKAPTFGTSSSISAPSVANSTSTAPSVFGVAPATSTNTNSALAAFGAKPSSGQTSASFSFGAQPAAGTAAPTNSATPRLGLFGTAPQATTTATSTPAAPVLGNNPAPLFGSQPNSAGQAPATTNSIFGTSNAATTGGAQPLFVTPTTNQTSVQTGSIFGTTSSISSPSKGFASTSSSVTAQPKPFAPPTSQTVVSAAAAPLFGAAPVTSATSTTPLFGAKPSIGQASAPLAFVAQTTAATPASTTTSAPVSSTNSSAGQTTAPLSFGAQPASATSVPASSAAPTLGPLGTAPQTQTVTAATQAASVFGASNDSAKMSYKDLEQTLKVLRMDFENQEKQFLDEVDDLNTYDNILRRAQDKIGGLAVDVDQLEREKDRFKYELQVVEQQQTELDNLVTEMEKVLGLPDYTQGTPIGIREPATTADVQRQNILQLQVTVDAQLKQIDDDVTDICEQLLDLQKIGGISGLESGEVDPEKEEQASIMDQIRQILRKQIDTLGWVDKQSETLGKKVQKTAAEILTLQK